MNLIFTILLILLIFSLLGWGWEYILKCLTNRCNFYDKTLYYISEIKLSLIYGIGALIIYFITKTLIKYNIFSQYIILVFILTIYEYINGITSEKLFNIESWNYNNNLKYVSLKTSLVWGVFGVILIQIFNWAMNNNYIYSY
jgi:uncharacterized membrane protein